MQREDGLEKRRLVAAKQDKLQVVEGRWKGMAATKSDGKCRNPPELYRGCPLGGSPALPYDCIILICISSTSSSQLPQQTPRALGLIVLEPLPSHNIHALPAQHLYTLELTASDLRIDIAS